jgi:hypothetical protein
MAKPRSRFLCFGTACGAIMVEVANGTTISCSLGRQYWPVLSLSFLDVYGLDMQECQGEQEKIMQLCEKIKSSFIKC